MTKQRWPLAAFLTSLPLDFAEAVAAVARLGFTHVDVVALADRPAAHLEALADSGLLVSCGALGRDLPPGHRLDATEITTRRAALRLVERQIADVARLGATCAYLTPPPDDTGAGLPAFAEACALLADYAGQRMVRVCVEPIPGRLLPDVRTTLAWLETVGHAELKLLLDVGHCLISGEDPATAARQAGTRLGYVHLDDNDAKGDLHWPLLTGQLTAVMLEQLLAVLREAEWQGGFALELNARNPEPIEALGRSKVIAEGVLQ
jgi:sugar phosphate isomerase/epimerase